MRLLRHAFPLGVSLQTRLETTHSAADYAWLLRTAAQHFWTGSLQTQMQWSTYEPSRGVVERTHAAITELVEWARGERWLPLSASLFDGGNADAEHWTNKLPCNQLAESLHERLARDLHAFHGKFGRYEVWRDTLRHREWIDRCDALRSCAPSPFPAASTPPTTQQPIAPPQVQARPPPPGAARTS